MSLKWIPLLIAIVGVFTLFVSIYGGVSQHTSPGSNPEAFALRLRTREPGVNPPQQSLVTQPAPESRQTGRDLCWPLAINQSHTGSFSVDLCFSSLGCSGQLSVKVNQCMLYAPRRISNDDQVDSDLRAWGPDLIRVRLEGPEVIAGLARYVGDCEYRFEFMLGTQGIYNLATERLYARFDAVNEAFSDWPNMLKESLLEVRAESSHYHFQQRTLTSNINLQCDAPSVDIRLNRSFPCSGRESSLGGRWVRTHPPKHIFSRIRVKKIQKNPILFQWALQAEPLVHWRPDLCEIYRHGLLDGVLSRYAGKRIVVVGDSQLRALYFGLANVLNRNGVDCVQNISSVEDEPSHCIHNVKGSHRKKIEGIQLDFFDDLFLEKFAASSKFDGYDVIVAGFAQHPASKEHWPIRRYIGSVEQKARKIEGLLQRGKQVIWYLAPQYPHTRSGYPVAVKDWRTDARLTIFNTIAADRLRRLHVPLLDGYNISTAMSHTSPDQAHFSNFVSYEIVQVLLSMLSGSAF